MRRQHRAIAAARRAMDCLERDAPIGTEDLATIARVCGDHDSAEVLRKRKKSGLVALTASQRILAIGELQTFIRKQRGRGN